MSTGEAHSTLRDGRGFYVVLHAESYPAEAACGDGFPRRALLDAFVAVQRSPVPLIFSASSAFAQRNDGNPPREDDPANREGRLAVRIIETRARALLSCGEREPAIVIRVVETEMVQRIATSTTLVMEKENLL